MSKSQIAAILFRMKRSGQSVLTVGNELYSADELLTAYYGREIAESMAQDFIGNHA